MPERRVIQYQSYDQMLSDLDHLLASGYDRLGNWSAGMIADHLAKTMNMAFGNTGKGMPRLIRPILRVVALKRILNKGMARNMPAPKAIQPPATITDDAGRAALVEAIGLAKRWTAPTINHPVFGHISTETNHRLQYVHAAHHLSLLVPKQR